MNLSLVAFVAAYSLIPPQGVNARIVVFSMIIWSTDNCETVNEIFTETTLECVNEISTGLAYDSQIFLPVTTDQPFILS